MPEREGRRFGGMTGWEGRRFGGMPEREGLRQGGMPRRRLQGIRQAEALQAVYSATISCVPFASWSASATERMAGLSYVE